MKGRLKRFSRFRGLQTSTLTPLRAAALTVGLTIVLMCLMLETINSDYVSARDELTPPSKKFDSIMIENGKHALWSKGYQFLSTCPSVPPPYYVAPTESRVSGSEMQLYFNGCKGGVLWVRLNDVRTFGEKGIEGVEGEFVLVTTDGDASEHQGDESTGVQGMPGYVGDQVTGEVLNDSRVKGWYMQNYDGGTEHWKVMYMPIGFDLHSGTGVGDLVRGREGMEEGNGIVEREVRTRAKRKAGKGLKV